MCTSTCFLFYVSVENENNIRRLSVEAFDARNFKIHAPAAIIFSDYKISA